MGQDKKTPITIDDVEYNFEDLTAEQQTLFNHCVDLDRKISSAKFNLDQLAVGKQAFINILKDSLVATNDTDTLCFNRYGLS
jgi:hypothetical protein